MEPTLEIPVVKLIDPLMPVCPAFGDANTKEPEEVKVLEAETNDMAPPVRLSPRPP